MKFAAFSAVALMADMGAAAVESRRFFVLHFTNNGVTTCRADPIVNPGMPSGHVHFIQGGSNIAFNSTGESLQSSNCSTALVHGDNSNYWTSTVYFQDPKTKKLEPVEPFYQNVYYFVDPTDDDVKAFPRGLQIFTGNVSLRTPPWTSGTNLDPSQGPIQNIKWTCPRSDSSYNPPSWPADSDGTTAGMQDPNNKGEGVGFPDCTCDGYASPLRGDIHFPSCYNPKAGLTNYQENMAFPTDNGKGKLNCPPGWIHLVHLFYETYWNTLPFQGRWDEHQGKQPFVLSNGDSTGYSYHGDFMASWDEDKLQNMIDNCDAGTAGADKCPGITQLNQGDCTIPPLVDEPLGPSLDQLPGNNPITGWQNGNGNGNPPAPAPAPSHSSSSSPSPSPSPSASPSPSSPSSHANPPPPPPSSSSSHNSPAPSSPSPPSHAPSPPSPSQPPPPSSHVPPPPPTNNHQDSTTISTSIVTSLVTVTVTQSSPSNGPCLPPPAPSPSPSHSQDQPGSGSGSSSSSSSVTVGQPAPTTVLDYQFVGCFRDASDRVLTGDSLPNLGPMTNAKCIGDCKAKGYDLAGTENGGQCFCGNELVGSSQLDDSDCSQPCEGDSSDTCGGGWSLSVYSKNGKAGVKGVKARHALRHFGKHRRNYH